MADFLVTDLETAVRAEIQDPDGTQWGDPELLSYINEGIRFLYAELFRQHREALLLERHLYEELEYEDFSSEDEIDLPTDFFRHILIKVSGLTKRVRRVGLDLIDDSTTEARCFVRGASVGAPVPNSANAGTDDLITGGNFTGNSNANEVITLTMASASTFNWSSSVSGSDTGVSTSTDWITLQNGIKVKFGATAGHTTGDSWTFTCYYDQVINIMKLNWDPDTDIELYYIKRPEKITLSAGAMPTSTYLPLYRYYDALKMYVVIRAMNRNEIHVGQDLGLFSPVIKLITDIASDIAEDMFAKFEPDNVALDHL
jgi:hypothetical protein